MARKLPKEEYGKNTLQFSCEIALLIVVIPLPFYLVSPIANMIGLFIGFVVTPLLIWSYYRCERSEYYHRVLKIFKENEFLRDNHTDRNVYLNKLKEYFSEKEIIKILYEIAYKDQLDDHSI